MEIYPITTTFSTFWKILLYRIPKYIDRLFKMDLALVDDNEIGYRDIGQGYNYQIEINETGFISERGRLSVIIIVLFLIFILLMFLLLRDL